MFVDVAVVNECLLPNFYSEHAFKFVVRKIIKFLTLLSPIIM